MPGPDSTKWQFHSWARVATTPVRGQSRIAWDSTGWGGRWTPEGTCACGSLGQVVPQISKATFFWKVKLSILECLSSVQRMSTARTGRERVPAAQTWLLQENQVSCSFTGCFHSQGAPVPQRNRFIVLHLILLPIIIHQLEPMKKLYKRHTSSREGSHTPARARTNTCAAVTAHSRTAARREGLTRERLLGRREMC